ncbi:putative cysZ protein [Methylocaldum marinum]|uniref:Putative cysZ protein n=1 Tax=Methylocaldum marinum TaxID=1432792 RepID=A0A250L2H9_9GAMM|nr:sulfate transporter CysZ [Methylocaldum marinum]BBA36709.1 putative cysZ protein [Methylocaldum marinum]
MNDPVNIRKLNNVHLSAVCLLRGLRLLAKPGLRHLVGIPLLINLVLYSIAMAGGIYYFSAFIDWLLPAWLDFLRWLLWPIFGLSFLLIVYFTFTLLANLIGAPFYGRLAEKTIVLQTGRPLPEAGDSLSKALVSDSLSEAKRLIYFLTRAVPLLILFLIPGLNLFAPFIWLTFSAWFLAIEYLAYPLEVHGYRFDEQRRIAKKLPFGVFSFGGLVTLALTIPVLNVLIPPAAVIGATLYLLEGQLGELSDTDSANT